MQDQLEAKDWRGVLQDAQQKYEIDWPNDSEEVQEDPAFQQMWEELGGNTAVQKSVAKKNVHVEIKEQHNTHTNKQYA